MNVIELELDKIKPYEKNPRKNDRAVDGVAESIKQFGFQQPIVVDKNNIIVVGHTRYKAAQKLGMTTVPCVLADQLTKEQVKAYRIADNKLNELATWDFELLGEELASFEFNFEPFEFQLPELFSETQYVVSSDVESDNDDEALLQDQDTPNDASANTSLSLPEHAREEWQGMPEFENINRTPIHVMVQFQNVQDKIRFGEFIGKTINEKTSYVNWPDDIPYLDNKKKVVE